ncbi:MAG: hypothetical protein GY820_47180 [Gammaproteobacteria bacterium]|nr:hypothetical protein [Gammaproteobacteria bacterium]
MAKNGANIDWVSSAFSKAVCDETKRSDRRRRNHRSHFRASVVVEKILSQRLAKTVVCVSDENGSLRRYRLTNRSRHGETEYYRCSICDCLNKKEPCGIRGKIRLRNGQLLGKSTPHHPRCVPPTSKQVVATDIDRRSRRNVRLGFATPRQAWKEVHDDNIG